MVYTFSMNTPQCVVVWCCTSLPHGLGKSPHRQTYSTSLNRPHPKAIFVGIFQVFPQYITCCVFGKHLANILNKQTDLKKYVHYCTHFSQTSYLLFRQTCFYILHVHVHVHVLFTQHSHVIMYTCTCTVLLTYSHKGAWERKTHGSAHISSHEYWYILRKPSSSIHVCIIQCHVHVHVYNTAEHTWRVEHEQV